MKREVEKFHLYFTLNVFLSRRGARTPSTHTFMPVNRRSPFRCGRRRFRWQGRAAPVPRDGALSEQCADGRGTALTCAFIRASQCAGALTASDVTDGFPNPNVRNRLHARERWE
ncbi:hypothetical protein EVAR_38356_1 [Eumeta japonica]|uniref:Uncharacterized protein n=1 Tax=Eumeta variegata TaxID=151549 RepID=A0A4C1XWC2_EUMVA|nr:hypothetical protein EVAR_38356_1 [Eumeta japonica]